MARLALGPPPSVLRPPSSVLCPLPSVLRPPSSVLCPLPSALRPPPSALCPLPSVLCPLPSALCPPPSAPMTSHLRSTSSSLPRRAFGLRISDFGFRISALPSPLSSLRFSVFGFRISIPTALAALLLVSAAQASDPPSAPRPSGALTNAEPSSHGLTSATVLRDPIALAALMTSLDDSKKLGPGDKITYRVLEDQDETSPLIVSDAGDVDVPYLGLVSAMKKSCKQVALEIKDRLEKSTYRRATVIISLQEINRKRILGKVYVVGQVRQSGPQEIPDDEIFTVSKAILKAGGFSDFADKHKVRLTRGGARTGNATNTMIINVAEIWEKGKKANDVPVEADDLVYVPKRSVNF